MQLGISVLDEEGGGHGYRISGPKYSGNSKPLLRHTIDERDADEIRRYLDRVSPGAAVGRVAQLEALLADLAVQQPEAVDDYRRRLAAVETLRKGTPDAT
jgi:predicted transcriptional regulator of viral defense system